MTNLQALQNLEIAAAAFLAPTLKVNSLKRNTSCLESRCSGAVFYMTQTSVTDNATIIMEAENND